MNKNEALKQINLISETINSDNQILLSSKVLVVIGGLICLIPLIEYSTDSLTFGYEMPKILNSVLHCVLYFSLFYFGGRLAHPKRKFKKSRHPLINKSLNVVSPIVISIIATGFVFSLIGAGDLVFPIIYIFLGFIYYLLGQFSIKFVRIVSWTYIIGGFLYAYLTQYKLPEIWIFFILYLGISYIAMGVALNLYNFYPALFWQKIFYSCCIIFIII